MSSRLVAGVAIALLALAVAATRHASPRPLAQKCGTNTYGVAAAPFWLAAADGVHLYALETGGGKVGVVLLHESPADLCGWLPFMPVLSRAGFRVLAFDFRGFGDSDRPQKTSDFLAYGPDIRAAVARLREQGAKRVFLIGASFGGVAALTYAPGLPVSGVVSFSGELAIPGTGLNAYAAVPHLRVPLLIVDARHDRYLPVPDALTLLRRADSKDKHIALYPGGFHGWDVVETAPYAARARARVLGWLRAHA